MGKPEAIEPNAPFNVDKAELVRRLAAVLRPGCLLHETEELKPYECDGLSAYREVPLAVALPEDEAQVAATLRVCHQLKVPVVARGAGTGLSGGAMPHAQGVLLGLSKMKRILEVDPVARIARVQPGVRNLAISEAAAPHGLYYAPDPSSQIACSIGGNVAENSGGVHCLKYGLTVHNVLKLRTVTIEGEIVEIGSDGLDAPGYDLLALLIGSEGRFSQSVAQTCTTLMLSGMAFRTSSQRSTNLSISMVSSSTMKNSGAPLASAVSSAIRALRQTPNTLGWM